MTGERVLNWIDADGLAAMHARGWRERYRDIARDDGRTVVVFGSTDGKWETMRSLRDPNTPPYEPQQLGLLT